MRTLRNFLKDSGATTMIEFVVIAPLFFALVFGIVEMGLAIYWWKSIEEAAQLGARMAVVRDPAAVGVPTINGYTGDGFLGQACREAEAPCNDFGTIECTGAACGGAGFPTILASMTQVFPMITANNVRISYRYVGVGFAGGPAVPAVTVTITGVRYPFFVLGAVFSVFGAFTNLPQTIPDIRATLTGEDMTTAGA